MGEVAVVGLGAMGAPIARNLLAAGHQVTVWNRSGERSAQLAALGAHVAATVSDAFQTPVVFSVLADDAAVSRVILNSGALEAAHPGTVHVNLATVGVTFASQMNDRHAAHHVGYLAAPVFGRVPVAEAGTLQVLVGGDPALVARVQPFFDVIGARSWHIGPKPEQANAVKLLGNYLVACAIQSLGEAATVAEREGIDPHNLFDLLGATLFPGPVYSTYGQIIADREYHPAGFTAALGRKDLLLALEVAHQAGARLPFGDVLRDAFDQTISRGHSEDDWAVIAEVPRSATIDPPVG